MMVKLKQMNKIFKQFSLKSKQRDNKLKEIKEILEFKANIIEKYKNQFNEEYLIGSGSFCKVYKVNDKSDGNVYAIKIISGIYYISIY